MSERSSSACAANVARPPFALARMSRDGDGLVVHPLKRPFRDGNTEFCCTGVMYECRGRARIAPAILLHFRLPSRSDAGSDATDPRVIGPLLEHIDTRAARDPPGAGLSTS